MGVGQPVEADLGWKQPVETNRKRRKWKGAAEVEDGTLDDSLLDTAEVKQVSSASFVLES